ncbi:MAG: YceI family protein [Burkholderiales bacterium]|nr:YceI family protein [Burkholderiales bacterium]
MKFQYLGFLAVAAIALPAAAADTFTVDGNHTIPTFEVSHYGFSIYRGRFDKTAGKVTLDRATKQGSADITIDAASVSTSSPRLNERLRSEDFFNVAQFPTITFKSDNFTFNGDRLVGMAGNLTILGVTRPVTLQVGYFHCGPYRNTKREACGADASTTIKRSDFGMKYGLPALGDEVKLLLGVEGIMDQ